MNKKYYSFKLWERDSYKYKHGYAIWLKIQKNGRKMYSTGLYAWPHQWDGERECFVTDKRTKNLHPNRDINNKWLLRKKVEIDNIINEFERAKIDWTIFQFDQILNKYTEPNNVTEYLKELINALYDSNHEGNAKCYGQMFHMLGLYDRNLPHRVFSEIDLRYVKDFDLFLQKRGCSGNTRKFYLKQLRAVLNKAVEDKKASDSIYPFGKKGFRISKLEEETRKRFLVSQELGDLILKEGSKPNIEWARRLFIFAYYCHGMSYIDMAHLKRTNLVRYDNGFYIVYSRKKIHENSKAKLHHIHITAEIQELLDWFENNTVLIEDYLLPIVSIAGYKGRQLYNHIRYRYRRYEENLKLLAAELGITRQGLTSHVARHTMAMTLQNHEIPREVISQILGHKSMDTTNIYLNSFADPVIDNAAKTLYEIKQKEL